jgi:hypothetical protein
LGWNKQSVNGAPASFTTSNNNNFGWTAGIGVEWF